ncbi:MAG TPA: hypothetical protein DHW34_05815 [Actinobacteria bacterium]|nr:hypothetical protein [Actinomycetota bacterium]
MTIDDPFRGDPEGAALFDAMVRWRALSTTAILMGFGSGLGHLIVSGTGGPSQLARALAGVAVVCIMGSVVVTIIAWRARRRFLSWFEKAHSD